MLLLSLSKVSYFYAVKTTSIQAVTLSRVDADVPEQWRLSSECPVQHDRSRHSKLHLQAKFHRRRCNLQRHCGEGEQLKYNESGAAGLCTNCCLVTGNRDTSTHGLLLWSDGE